MGLKTSEKDMRQQDKENEMGYSRGWSLPQMRVQRLVAGLYVVATPIGNMGDISFRALDILAGVDVIFCEDTRVSGKLLAHFGIEAKLQVYNDHSDAKLRADIKRRIESGQSVALISDAGMPLISDPGYKLVHDLREAGLYVGSIPGANAPLAALQLSGLPSDKFSFLGFLPPKSEARRCVLEQWAAVPCTLVMFETAPRLLAALKDIEAALGKRSVAVVREITKKFENTQKGSAAELVTYYEAHGVPKGEIVIVVGPPEERAFNAEQIEALLKDALKSMSTKDAAAEISRVSGVPKKELYQKALNMMEVKKR